MPSDNAKRVLVLGATFNTDNMGVGALASGAVSILAHRFPGADIRFLDYGRVATESMVHLAGREIRVPLVNLRFSWKLFLKNNIAHLLLLAGLCRLLGKGAAAAIARGNRWFAAIRGADLAVAVSGGDSFSDIYGLGRFLYVYLPQWLVVSMGVRLVLLPQTVGPFRTATAKWLARRLLRRVELIYCRDRACLADLESLFGTEVARRARFCYDMGFILEPRSPPEDALSDMRFQSLDRDALVVGLNVSGLLLMGGYSKSNDFGLKIDYGSLTERIAELLVSNGAQIVLVPHVFGTDEESDSIGCARMYKVLSQRFPGRVACLQGRLDQNEVKYAIGRCQLFVGARMHACIAALSQAVPAVGIAYSQKFLGVFETVGAGELVADPRRHDMDDILKIVTDALAHRQFIREKLLHTMSQVRRELLTSMDGVA